MNSGDDTIRLGLSFWQRTRAYAQLLRLANVFTVVSDTWMGLILTTGKLDPIPTVLATSTSCLLFLAGMVLNDVFDVEKDSVERPERPIPSGRVSVASARTLGFGLLGGGVAMGWATTLVATSMAPGVFAMLLALLVLGYDAKLKKTLVGPAAMAGCRVLNLVFAMSLTAEWTGTTFQFHAPVIPIVGIGFYIFCVTWFARSEAAESTRWLLALSTLGAGLCLLAIAAMPWIEPARAWRLRLHDFHWCMYWFVAAAIVLRHMLYATVSLRPQRVQYAVGQALLGLIVIDAGIVLGYATPFWALAVFLLLAPATLLAQWIKVS